MNRKIFWWCGIFVFGIAVMASAQVKQQEVSKASEPSIEGKALVDAVHITATVEAIDHKNRTVSLKGPMGDVRTLKVGPIARNFDQVKKGDKVNVTYYEALALDLQKGLGKPGAATAVSLDRAPIGANPAGSINQTIAISATIENIDRENRVVTLRGPEGRVVNVKVSDQSKHFDEVKKGDDVVVSYTEGLAISVDKG